MYLNMTFEEKKEKLTSAIMQLSEEECGCILDEIGRRMDGHGIKDHTDPAYCGE